MNGEKSKKKEGTAGKVPSPKCKCCKNSLTYFTCFPASMQALTARTGSIQFSFFPCFCIEKRQVCHTKLTGTRGMKEEGGRGSLSEST